VTAPADCPVFAEAASEIIVLIAGYSSYSSSTVFIPLNIVSPFPLINSRTASLFSFFRTTILDSLSSFYVLPIKVQAPVFVFYSFQKIYV